MSEKVIILIERTKQKNKNYLMSYSFSLDGLNDYVSEVQDVHKKTNS